jgi:radical SAM superfamily enzyme YgiQ (UPF0313 family)
MPTGGCTVRVLLVYPHSHQEVLGYGDLGAVAEPLALEYLAAGARLDGHTVRILDLRLHRRQLTDVVRDYAPDVIGITGYSMHVLRNLEICRQVRALLPAARTVVGGHHATLLPEDFFIPEVDYVVAGEGVVPFRRLLRRLEDRDPVRDITGVWSRLDGPNSPFVNGGVRPALSLDDLPLPDRSLVPEDRGAYFIDWMKPIALLRSSVGCPYRCSFCSLWRIMDGRYHVREVERVVQELREVPEECVFLVDDEPFVNGPRMAAMAEAIATSGIRKRYFAYCRIDTLLRQPDLLRRWRGIGLERLFLGIEAITETGLDEYNKRLDLLQIEDGLQLCRTLGIHVFASFVVNTNYTRADFSRLVRFIEHQGIDYPSFTILTPIPGTAALSTFDEVIERQASGRPNWDLFDLQHPVTRTHLPREEFMREYRQLHRVFAKGYRPSQDPSNSAQPSRAVAAPF